ncbi:MAG: threonylcarbamoyl-AMP synthase [bacterium]|nr:threonylcarbamoyl-AMP synthase [bacterium]
MRPFPKIPLPETVILSPEASHDFSHRVVRIDLHSREPAKLKMAAQIIQKGGLLIFPTDTIYGLGCSAFHEPSLERIFSIKGRPASKPLPTLVSGPSQLADLIAGQISDLAKEIIQEFWPGGLTLVFPAGEKVPAMISGGSGTIGLRMPNCQLVLDLIDLVQLPLVATSVNRSGQPGLRDINKIIAEWAPFVDLILDAGPLPDSPASTVLDLTTQPPKLLREGAVSAQRLSRYLKSEPGADRKTTG